MYLTGRVRRDRFHFWLNNSHGRSAPPQRLGHRALGRRVSARETERPDAAFRDPFARRLAGERVRRHRRLDAVLREGLVVVRRPHGPLRPLHRGGGARRGGPRREPRGRPRRALQDGPAFVAEVGRGGSPGILSYKEEVLAARSPSARSSAWRSTSRTPRRGARSSSGSADSRRALVVSEGSLIYLDPLRRRARSRATSPSRRASGGGSSTSRRRVS